MTMKYLSIFIFSLIICHLNISAQSDDTEKENKARAQMNNIIKLIKQDDINQLANFIQFPIDRPDPIPNIYSKESFILYYPTLFDSAFKSIFLDTMQMFDDMRVDIYTYHVGFHHGDLYLNDNGIITSINYTSPTEKNLIKALNNEANSLMPVTKCKELLLVLKSENFTIRIDLMEDNSARYISWSSPKKISDKPDLILLNGTYEYQGNMGSVTYTFRNGEWTYIVDYVAICGSDIDCGYYLRLYQNDIEKKSIRMTRFKNNGL
jgi:hypothetical protein